MDFLYILGKAVQIAFAISLYFMFLNLMIQKRHTLEAQETYYQDLSYRIQEKTI